MQRVLDLLIRAVDWIGRIKDTWEVSPWLWRIVWFLVGPGVIGYGAYDFELSIPGKVLFFVVLMTLWCVAAHYWTLRRERLAAPRASIAAPSAASALLVEPPANVTARAALLYAANGTWALRQHNKPINAGTARELQRVLDVLDRFYESASHEGGLRVWGRTSMARPLRLIERTHWQDWHIRHPDIFGTEPLRTVPRDRLPSDSSPYFDLHLNKAEVEAIWPADTARQMHLNEIARLREQISELRIAMEDRQSTNTAPELWEDRYEGLQHAVSHHIEAVAGPAEASAYISHGNVHRRTDGPPHQLYIDMCIRDLDYLLKFIQDYSRERRT